jgi:hypothetical protein
MSRAVELLFLIRTVVSPFSSISATAFVGFDFSLIFVQTTVFECAWLSRQWMGFA